MERIDGKPYENRIIHEDCVSGMGKLPAGCAELVIADPPYNLSGGKALSYGGGLPGMGGAWKKVKESWDDMGLRDYAEFTRRWVRAAARLLSEEGSMWVFGTFHGIGIVEAVCRDEGLDLLGEAVWYKRNAFPNLSGRRLTASHENILRVAAPGSRPFEDRAFAEAAAASNVFGKGDAFSGVWDIPANKKPSELEFGRHPAQKPLRLLDRLVRLSSRPGSLVAVPFAGSGSECDAALRAGRRFVGFETDALWCAAARKRLEAAEKSM